MLLHYLVKHPSFSLAMVNGPIFLRQSTYNKTASNYEYKYRKRNGWHIFDDVSSVQNRMHHSPPPLSIFSVGRPTASVSPHCVAAVLPEQRRILNHCRRPGCDIPSLSNISPFHQNPPAYTHQLHQLSITL